MSDQGASNEAAAGGRPQSAARRAIAEAARVLQAGEVGLTVRQLANLASVDLGTTRQTVRNMLTSGELVKVGEIAEPGVRRLTILVAPAAPAGQSWAQAAAELTATIRLWVLASASATPQAK